MSDLQLPGLPTPLPAALAFAASSAQTVLHVTGAA